MESSNHKLYAWQRNMLNNLARGQEFKITMAGRQTGKSIWTNKAIKRLMDDLTNRPIEELVLSEARAFGARFYCVEPVGGNWLDMEVWCLDTFGASYNIWNLPADDYQVGRWYMNDRKFWFREERDRAWFIMRWSS